MSDFQIENGVLIKYTGNDAIVKIPNGVTSIGNEAFRWYDSLTSIEIPNSVIFIEDNAFEGCDRLVEVINKSKLKITKDSEDNGYIGFNALKIKKSGKSEIVNKDDYLFYSYKKINYLIGYIGTDTQLKLPKDYNGGNYEICKHAFACSNIKSVKIGNGVTGIGFYAFHSCLSLTSIEIPSNVIFIDDYAFEECDRLVEVINKSKLKITKDSEDNGYIGFNALKIKKSGKSEIVNKDDYLFYSYKKINYLIGYIGTDTQLKLPKGYNGENYEIWKYAFAYSNIKSVKIGNSVTRIGDDTFWDCTSLSSVTIGNNVTSIGKRAFSNCRALNSIEIPISVKDIGVSTFGGCTSLSRIEVDGENKNYSSIDGNLYNKDGTKLIKYAIDKKDTSFVIPKVVTSIGEGAFEDCTSLSSIEIPNSVTNIGDFAFSDCSSLDSIEIPNSVTSIDDYVFYGCKSIVSVEIPDSVTSIGERAFSKCSSLSSIEISNTVTNIRDNAFDKTTKIIRREK